MHILIISSIYPSENNLSKGIFIHDQALALEREGHKIGVLVSNYPHPKRVLKGNFSLRESIKFYEIDGMPVMNFIFLPIPLIHKPFTKIISGFYIRRYIKRYGKPDIIHAHFVWYGGIIAKIINEITRIPFVVTAHSSEHFRENISKYKYNETKLVLKNADQLISVSKFLGERLNTNYKIDQIDIMPNTVDTDIFTPLLMKIDKTKFYFTSIGRLIKSKRYDNLLIAFSSFSNLENIYLNIIGDGPERRNLEQLAIELGIEEQVIFHGFLNRPKVFGVLQQSNVLVSSSDLETFGVTLIEALSCGIPVLATRSGGPEEIINKTNGILVNNQDEHQLTEGLKKIYIDYQRFDPEKIRSECIKKYGYDKISNQLTKIYKKVILNT